MLAPLPPPEGVNMVVNLSININKKGGNFLFFYFITFLTLNPDFQHTA
jgi:hypothetical protein